MKLKRGFIFISGVLLVVILGIGSIFAQDDRDLEKEAAESAFDKLEELRQSIGDSQSQLGKSLLKSSLLEERLSEVSDEIESLEDQVQAFDSRLSDTQVRIDFLDSRINELESKIDETKADIVLLEQEISVQKTKFKELLVILYLENQSAGFFDDSELQTLKLLLGSESVSDVIERSDGLAIVEFALADLLNGLRNSQDQLFIDKSELETNLDEQNKVRNDVNRERVYLSLQRDAKAKLLETTQGEEEIYKELIRRARVEQLQIRSDINLLITDYAEVKGRFNQEDFGNEIFSLAPDSDKFSWPVDPDSGISAYFKDPSYRAALGVEHNAIDIRVPMQSDVIAPADSVVLKVVGGDDLNYHYVILAHNGGFMTLYGHMYDIFVYEGQQLNRGDLIGLSGGMPGTRGAGWLTTGPHLHFEVFLNGVHVDPLDYMDLSEIDEEEL